jgi:hypothetical protein
LIKIVRVSPPVERVLQLVAPPTAARWLFNEKRIIFKIILVPSFEVENNCRSSCEPDIGQVGPTRRGIVEADAQLLLHLLRRLQSFRVDEHALRINPMRIEVILYFLRSWRVA